jgi:transposase
MCPVRAWPRRDSREGCRGPNVGLSALDHSLKAECMAVGSQPVPTESTDVIIGVDPHKRSHTAAVLIGQRVLDQLRVPATPAGIQQLHRWASQWPERRWAIENAYGLGRCLSQVLLDAGETVLDVPPALSHRVRLLSGRSGRKTDIADAISTARAAVGPGVRLISQADSTYAALRLLSDRRQDLVARRTQCFNRLHVLLAELLPGQVRRGISSDDAAGLLRQVRAPTGCNGVRRGLARQVLAEIRSLERAIAELDAQLETMLAASGTSLRKLHGVGTVVAATLLGHIGDIRRFPSAGHLAAYCGVAPLEASSGDVVRHRLSRLGDRQLNAALYVMALSQAASHPLGRAYYQRKLAEGHSKAEALRCLKRRLVDVIYRCLRRDTDADQTLAAVGQPRAPLPAARFWARTRYLGSRLHRERRKSSSPRVERDGAPRHFGSVG